jgi:radical SAM superfamily enzyme YgiQ (UPF0313 family)
MKILFLETLYSGAYLRGEPLSIMQLSSILKSAGHETDLADISSMRKVRQRVDAFKPDILAYSIRTGFHKRKFWLNRMLKSDNRSVFSVFGGSHATFYPECIEEDGVDAVCLGEGDVAFLELCDRMQRSQEIVDTQNFWVKKEGMVHKNPLRPMVSDLDSLPVLDRGLLYQYVHKRDFPIKSVITSRGCPFSCSYCYNEGLRNLYGNTEGFLRRQSPERAIREIEHLKESAGLRYLVFEDDVFTFDKKWILDFLPLYRKRIGLPFSIYTHARFIDHQIAVILKDAGCHDVGIGIECADDMIRKVILNRYTSNSEIESACVILKEAGIKICAGNIIGIPGTGIDTDIETLKLNIKYRVDTVSVSLLAPFPQTPIAKTMEKHGFEVLPLEDFTSMRYPRSFIKSPWNREVERLLLLFPVIVAYPAMLKHIRFLLRLPVNMIYYLLAKIFKLSSFRWITGLNLQTKELISLARGNILFLLRKEV